MKRTARDILQEKGGHMITINADATVFQALTVMTQNKVGSIVLLEDEKIVGIWTERDLMFRALEEGFDPKTARLKDNMSEHLISANVDEQAYQLYDKFLGRRIRHLLIEEDGEYIGLLSVGDVMKANLQQKNEEFDELNNMVSLEYYENWKDLQSER
ncbi:MAG: CBS domain-containing protein [Pseudohongiella sp.]|jgi:signal-transduction protein with cAMP-binding, CBS, and nucleotidyltransferase domain|nr:CBS domain-containing protein [Pseudohongiella sp.]